MKEMAYSSDPNADREILDEGYVHGYHYCIVSLGSHPCAYVEIPKDQYMLKDYVTGVYSTVEGMKRIPRKVSVLCFRMRSGLAGTICTLVIVSSYRATVPEERHGQRARY